MLLYRSVSADSEDSSCSYLKCSGTSCQPFSSTSASSSSSTSTSTLSSSTFTGMYPCTNVANAEPEPDGTTTQEGYDVCLCNNGASIPPDSSLGCNWQTLPPRALSTPSPGIVSGSYVPQYAYSGTDARGDTILCQNAGTDGLGEDVSTSCIGTPVYVYVAPTATVEVCSANVYVGGITSDTLFTSVSNALATMCPDPTASGASADCTGEPVAIKNVKFIDPDSQFEAGELVISVDESSYGNATLRDYLIWTIATAFNISTTTDDSCTTKDGQTCMTK